MLVIRLQRTGRRNQSSFRIVLAEKSAPIKGKFLEVLGSYSPRLKEKNVNGERVQYWLGKGAQASVTVHNILVGENVIQAPKVKSWAPKKKKTAEK